ncbi:MAG: amphi-Trp domain-containing protein [Deltaproteobacteria bacterium]|jgi:amphi-Trp domain-containing protein|nr:amphi-Trp domain-containing protein [Deltaproteobacteria bacterium]
MSKNRFHFKLVTDPLDVSRYLESLIQGFQDRELSLSDQNHQIVLRPAEIMELSVCSTRRKGQVNLTFSLSWAETVAHKQLSLNFDNLNNDAPEALATEESSQKPTPLDAFDQAAPPSQTPQPADSLTPSRQESDHEDAPI